MSSRLRLIASLVIGAAGAVSLARPVLADEIDGPPPGCPQRTVPRPSHSGGHCSPPYRGDCPPGYQPRVRDNISYCEPPPEKPCPEGSSWTSLGPDRAYCELGLLCGGGHCPGGCKDISLCVSRPKEARPGYHYADEVHGPCAEDADCKAFPGARCVTANRCDMIMSRTGEAERIVEAAKAGNVPVPSAYTARLGGPPPAYPDLVIAPASEAPEDDPSAKKGCAGCQIGSSREGAAPIVLGLLFLLSFARRRAR